jgi:hypothetical protein
MPSTCSTIPTTRSGHARHSPPASTSRKRANTAVSDNTPKRPKPNADDDDEAEGKKTKGGREGKKNREKEKSRGRKQNKAR